MLVLVDGEVEEEEEMGLDILGMGAEWAGGEERKRVGGGGVRVVAGWLVGWVGWWVVVAC